MSPEILIALISSVFYFIGILPYFRDTLNGKTLPHPFSYFVWLILTGFNTYVLLSQNEYISLIPAILNTLSCIVFTLFGIRAWRKIQINWFDYWFLFLALCLLPFYFYTRDVLLTVIFSVVIDFLGYLPTLKKWWLQPWSETLFTFFVIGIAQLLIIFAQGDYTLASSLFWGYSFIVNMIFVVLMVYRRYYLKGWGSIFE
jgi:hypothetical protein